MAKRNKRKKRSFLGRVFYVLLFTIFVYFGVTTLSYADTLRFAHVSDVHLSDRTTDTSYKVLTASDEILKDVVEQINDMSNIDFILETGDLVDVPQKSLLEQACNRMNKLKSPWYFAFGNHDAGVGTSFQKPQYFAYLQKHNKSMKNFEHRYYSFIPKKGYRVIVLDATIDSRLTSNGELPEEQLKWLDEQLSIAKKSNQLPLMFLHHPLHEPFPSYNHRIINAAEFKAVLEKYDMPMAIFTGHYHAARIYKEGNILHVSTPSMVSYPCAFRVITINNLKNKVIFTFDFRETNVKDAQKKAKLLTFSSGTYKGEDNDRDTIVTLDK